MPDEKENMTCQNILRVYTIGHSNHSLKKFLKLIGLFAVEVIVDIRSTPRSKIAPHFEREMLSKSLKENNLKYLYLGKELGGRPEKSNFYDSEGYVLYDRIARSPAFVEGIDRLLRGVKKYSVALLCSEENPINCHRRVLLGRVLKELGVNVLHILGDGKVQSEEELRNREESKNNGEGQIGLFIERGSHGWKSTQSVLPKRKLKDSSKH